MTFNKVNTFKWFKDNTYYLDDSYDPYDRVEAFRRALETDRLPLGVFYLNPNKPTFEENTGVYKDNPAPLFKRSVNKEKLAALLDSLRRS